MNLSPVTTARPILQDKKVLPVIAPIVSHREVAPSHFRLTLCASEIAERARAGHFVHLLPRESAQKDPLLRRAFSVVRREADKIEVLYRVMGRGTALLSRLKVGDTVDVMGPLGQEFAPVNSNVLLVGGGVGVPPLAMLAAQVRREQPATFIQVLLGARCEEEILCLEDFERDSIPIKIATENGSCGHHGRVTDLLKSHLQDPTATTNLTIYACGPWAMLHAVAQICEIYHVGCQVSLEECMPCGIGICNGCVIPVLGASDDYGRYRRICVDGPAVWAHEVDWDAH